jgi:hypothetical protein
LLAGDSFLQKFASYVATCQIRRPFHDVEQQDLCVEMMGKGSNLVDHCCGQRDPLDIERKKNPF